MKVGDLVKHDTIYWPVPGVIVKKPYGSFIPSIDGSPVVGIETMVVDVLVGTEIFPQIKTSDLKIIL